MLKSQSRELDMVCSHSEEKSLPEYLHVLIQDLSPCVIPVGWAATFMSILSAFFMAYKWKRTKNSKLQKVHKDDANYTAGGKEIENNYTNEQSVNVLVCQVEDNIQPAVTKEPEINQTNDQSMNVQGFQVEENIQPTLTKETEINQKLILDTIQGFQRIIPSLKQAVTMARIHKLEDQLKESYILQEKMENELKTPRRDLKTNHLKADFKLSQKDEELKKTTVRLNEMTEEYNKQQSLLHESKSETESLIKKNQELEKKFNELRKEFEQQFDAETLQERKDEQQKRKDAEQTLQELKTELENKDQKLKSLINKVESLHHALKRTENSQQVLMKELDNHKQQNNQQLGESLATEELKATQLKLDTRMSQIRDLFKEQRNCELYCAALGEKNQQLEAQLAELKERYKQEFRRIIKEEQERRAEIGVDVEYLKLDLEKKKNEVCKVQAETESEAHGDTASVPTEEEEMSEAETS